MQRSWIVGALILVMAAGLYEPAQSSSVSASSHVYALAAKQKCKYVTKKVHGKKKRVKVCRTVRPTATLTPTTTPLPTATATASPGTLVRLPPPEFDAGRITLHDLGTGITVDEPEYGSRVFGGPNDAGQVAPPGYVFSFFQFSESNAGTGMYVSAPSNFAVVAPDGRVFLGLPFAPATQANTRHPLQERTIDPGSTNVGYVEFVTPSNISEPGGSLRPGDVGDWLVCWNEHGVVPWTEVAYVVSVDGHPGPATAIPPSEWQCHAVGA